MSFNIYFEWGMSMKKSALLLAATVIAAGSLGTAAALAQSQSGLQETEQGSERGFHRMAKFHKFGNRHRGVLADLLGMTPEELRTQKERGVTLKELLEQNGLTKEDIHLAMRESVEEKLSALVKRGEITQEEADLKLGRMDAHHVAMQNGDFSFHKGHHKDFIAPLPVAS